MRRVIITTGDGQPLYRRATRQAATVEVYLPHANPAQSTRDGPGVRLAVQPDGTWQVAAITAYRPSTQPDRPHDRETVVASGDLTAPVPGATPSGTHSVSDTDAQALVRALAHRFGWAYVLYDRTEIAERVGADLTDAQWQRIRQTSAWDELSEHLRSFAHRAGLLTEVIEQAHLRCEFCTAPLDQPPPPGEPPRCPTCQTDPEPPEGATHA
jgi:hypothetical protein